MIAAVDEHATSCPRCAGPLAYQLTANDGLGGGFRYDVSCAPCGVVLYEICAPRVSVAAAA